MELSNPNCDFLSASPKESTLPVRRLDTVAASGRGRYERGNAGTAIHELRQSCVLDDIDEQFVIQYVEWRRGTTRTRAGKRRKGHVQLVDTKKPVSIASVNRDLATLRRILNIAREWKLVLTVPKIRLLPGETNHDRVLTHEEEHAYLEIASPLLKDFSMAALDTGMRPEEILRLRFEYVHFEPAGSAKYGYVHVPDGKTKKAKRNYRC